MGTEFVRNALKAVLFATRSRKEISDLGIKTDRTVNFLRKTVTTAEECENALVAAEDLLNIRYSRKTKLIDEQVEQVDRIDAKIARLGELLPDARKKDLLTEKKMFLERVEEDVS